MERDTSDLYITPKNIVDGCLSIFGNITPKTALDPCAGTGNWGIGIKNKWDNCVVTGVEIDNNLQQCDCYDQWMVGDFRDIVINKKFDLIISNPPFGISNGVKDSHIVEKFITKSIEMINDNGTVVYLLKTSYLEGQRRFNNLYRNIPPNEVYVSSRRVWFERRDGTKMGIKESYSLFVWKKQTMMTKLKWFDYLTKEVL